MMQQLQRQAVRSFAKKATGSRPSRTFPTHTPTPVLATSNGAPQTAVVDAKDVLKPNPKRDMAITAALGIPPFLYFFPDVRSWAQSQFVAHAGWVPHQDLPPPRTIKEAVHYNDYPPGFTESIPDYSDQPPIGVKKLVAGNLEEHIMQPDKDVFVQFSQEKCTSCQSFARILDALAFAFRDVPTVQFYEMKGTSNYVPGILTSEEEVLYPTFKLFEGGEGKQLELQRAKEFVKMVRDYNLKLLAEHNPEDPLPAGMMPTLDKSKFPGCGYSMPMNMGDEDLYVWDRFIDIIHEKAKFKFDKNAVKKQLSIIEPALKREISHNIRTTLPGYELVGSLAPCGRQWDEFQDCMLRRGVGSSRVEEFHQAMDNVRTCVVQQYPLENQFWKEMMNLSIHMTQTLNIVQQAKRQDGLTPEKSHEFFIELSEMMRKRNERQKKTEEEQYTNVPRPIQ